MIYQIENFSYDHSLGIIIQADKQHKLTKTQRKLLKYFLDNPRKIISKQTIMQEVWGRIITENSVDQIVSKLRTIIESVPTDPTIIITHFGQGISFEANVNVQDTDNHSANEKPNDHKYAKGSLLIVIVTVVVFFLYSQIDNTVETITNQAITNPIIKKPDSQNKQILILPMIFKGDSISSIEQQGMKSLLKSTFNALESEGQMLFDETSLTTQQAIEKHWSLESDLVVMRLNVVKNGEIYEAVIELSKGTEGLKKTTIFANSIDELLNKQITYISDYSKSISKKDITGIDGNYSNQKLIQAMGHIKAGQFKQAENHLLQILKIDGKNYKARLALAETFLKTKQVDKSLAQLNTLKSTTAYQLIGTEIELNLARIKYEKHKYASLIDDLKRFQASHFNISHIKKANIKLQIAKAYLANGNPEKAMTLYQQTIINVDEHLNPKIYAMSYYGQGKVLISTSIGQDVYDVFVKSLNYAQTAGDIHLQTLALNEMSFIALSSYDWENAIGLKKQALELMELDNNKSEVASGLGTLVAMLNLRGQFSEARSVNERLGSIAKQLKSDALLLHYLHYDAILAMNVFDWSHEQSQIDVQLKLAIKTNNYAMQLNNAFIAL